MKQFGKLMLLALGFGLLAIALSSLPNQPVLAGPGVTIVSPLPLPVSGMVGVNNFPAIQPISGTVNLGVGSTVGINGSVQVGNAATSPVLMRDVDSPRTVFNHEVGCFTSNAFRNCPAFQVPSGKLLVIENIAIDGVLLHGEPLLRWQLLISDTEGIHTLLLPVTLVFGDSASDHYALIQLVRLYAPQGAYVQFTFQRPNASPLGQAVGANVYVSGHFLDCGTGTDCPLP